jgi:hypothetical protein
MPKVTHGKKHDHPRAARGSGRARNLLVDNGSTTRSPRQSATRSGRASVRSARRPHDAFRRRPLVTCVPAYGQIARSRQHRSRGPATLACFSTGADSPVRGRLLLDRAQLHARRGAGGSAPTRSPGVGGERRRPATSSVALIRTRGCPSAPHGNQGNHQPRQNGLDCTRRRALSCTWPDDRIESTRRRESTRRHRATRRGRLVTTTAASKQDTTAAG